MFVPPFPFFQLGHTFARTETASFTGNPWKRIESDAVYIYSRGQWAIERLLKAAIKSKGKERGTIFIPGYFCEISLFPLRLESHNIIFYEINSDFQLSLKNLDELVDKHGVPDILLSVHYFGVPVELSEASEWCDKRNVLLVEDAAHSMLPLPGIGDSGNPVIYTPWKFINMPEGALLVLPDAKKELLGQLANENGLGGYPLSWIIKRNLQAFGAKTGISFYKLKKFRVKEHDDSEELNQPPRPECSQFSKRILGRYEEQIEEIRKTRESNFKTIDGLLKNGGMESFRIFRKLPQEFAPYVYPFRVPEKRSRELMVKLNEMGVAAMPWSDLSPGVKNSPSFPLSNALRREVVTLPIHHDVSQEQCQWMAEMVIEFFQ